MCKLLTPGPLEFGLALSEDEKRHQENFRSLVGRPFLAMVVSSSDRRKNWTPEEDTKLIDL